MKVYKERERGRKNEWDTMSEGRDRKWKRLGNIEHNQRMYLLGFIKAALSSKLLWKKSVSIKDENSFPLFIKICHLSPFKISESHYYIS